MVVVAVVVVVVVVVLLVVVVWREYVLTAVFRRVVVVDVHIALAIQLDIKATVLCELCDHVIEEPQPRAHQPYPGAVQPNLADDTCLLCFPTDLSGAERRRYTLLIMVQQVRLGHVTVYVWHLQGIWCQQVQHLAHSAVHHAVRPAA